MRTNLLRGVISRDFAVPARASIATPSEDVLERMPWSGQIVAAYFAPELDGTEDADGHFSITVRNRGPVGTDAITVAHLDYSVADVVVAANRSIPVPIAAHLADSYFLARDTLVAARRAVTAGRAMPAGVITLWMQGR